MFAILKVLYDALTGLLTQIDKSNIRGHNDAADYFDVLADTLLGMIAKLRAGDIPRVEGHTFESLVSGLPKRAAGLLAIGEVHDAVSHVRRAAEQARRLDWHYLRDDPATAVHRDEYLADMERVAGALKACAIKLRRNV